MYLKNCYLCELSSPQMTTAWSIMYSFILSTEFEWKLITASFMPTASFFFFFFLNSMSFYCVSASVIKFLLIGDYCLSIMLHALI